MLCIVGMLYKTVQLYLQIWAAKKAQHLASILDFCYHVWGMHVCLTLHLGYFAQCLPIYWLFQLVVCCQYNVSIDYLLISYNYFQDCPWYTNSSRFFWISLQIVLAFHSYHYPEHVRDGADKKNKNVKEMGNFAVFSFTVVSSAFQRTTGVDKAGHAILGKREANFSPLPPSSFFGVCVTK